MTREEMKNLIINHLEVVDDDNLIEYYNDTHDAKIYRDIDELFDEHCTCFSHALECLAPGFNYSPYGGYYGWNDGEICSADGITELIDLDDIAENIISDLEIGHETCGVDEIDDIMEGFCSEVKSWKRVSKIAEIADIKERLEAYTIALDRLTKELEELA